MNYESFLEKLKGDDFKVKGQSFAVKTFNDWSVAFIRQGGRFQTKNEICFVICARPINAKGLDGEVATESTNPHDYPFKLISSEISEKLKYESRLLNYELDKLGIDSDWSRIHELLVNSLPIQLAKLGVSGLLNQIKAQKTLGYIEEIWLQSLSTTLIEAV